MKKVLAFVLALALAVCGLTACSAQKDDGYTSENTEYVIGATGPLTGDASSYGISVQQGAQLAIEEINAAGGLNGVNFRLDMRDDKADAGEAQRAYLSLYEAGMQVSLGSVTSASCEAFGTKAAEDGLFFITIDNKSINAVFYEEMPKVFHCPLGSYTLLSIRSL